MKKVTLLLIFSAFCMISFAQFGALKDKLLTGKANPAIALLKKPSPITTSLDDVQFEGSLDEHFGNDSVYKPMTSLERSATGGFILKRGFYRFHDQSYCLKAGTHGPGGGDGYMYAPPVGKMDDIVKAIVRGSVNHPELKQQDIQVLLWGIIARTKLEDMQNKIKLTAAALLTAKQMLELNGGVIGVLPDAVMQKAMEGLPQGVKTVMEAENKLRQMLTSGNSSFEEMERVAVLAGMAPMGEGSREVASGRWSLHPDGYYVRYKPQGYTNTVVEIWVPKDSKGVGKEYDPATHIAVPGNTSRQRLIQSGRAYQ